MTLQQEYDNAVNEMNASKLDAQITLQALRAEFLERVHAAVEKTGMQDKIACQYVELYDDVDDIHEIDLLANIHDDHVIAILAIKFMLADNDDKNAMLKLHMNTCLDNDGKFSLMPLLDIDGFFTDGHDDYMVIIEFMHKFASQLGMITKYANSKKFMSMLQTIIDYAKTCVKTKKLEKDCVTDNVLRLKANDVVNMDDHCCKVTRCTSKRVYVKTHLGNEFFYTKNELVDAIMKYGWTIVHKS